MGTARYLKLPQTEAQTAIRPDFQPNQERSLKSMFSSVVKELFARALKMCCQSCPDPRRAEDGLMLTLLKGAFLQSSQE
jgi:hypothetical protein